MNNNEMVPVWTAEIGDNDADKNAFPSFTQGAVSYTLQVSKEVLNTSIRSFATQFVDLLDDTALGNSNVLIEEVELSLTVNAKGGIELLGKFEAGAEASIKVKLKRKA